MKLTCGLDGMVIIHSIKMVYSVMLSMTKRGQDCLGVHNNINGTLKYHSRNIGAG